jgi:phosphoglycolate phosphatase-like HAD superfamily hydrolase
MGSTGPIEGFRFDGKTDPQIVHELLRAFGNPHAESGAHVQAVCDRYVEMLEGELASGKRTPHVFPGVWELLDLIERRDDAVLGLLTGNLAAGARLKLASVGMEFDRFRVGAFGSDAADRGELPAIAAARAAELVGEPPTGEDIVIIGDTPADVTCGAGVGARAIAVATGSYGVAELAAAGAYAVFEDLLDTEGVLEAILGD